MLARIASKNHYNGARNPRAQFRREMASTRSAPCPPSPASSAVFDCAGVADGAAAAIVVRAEDAHRYTDKPLYVKALSFVAGNGVGPASIPTTTTRRSPRSRVCAADAYAQAGITDPRAELAMAEVHDCFTPTELVLMEDLGFSERGTAWKDIEAGAFDLDGELPVNPDGGLKSLRPPGGRQRPADDVRGWLQLRGEAPEERRIDTRPATASLALTHNLGGYPGEMVSFVVDPRHRALGVGVHPGSGVSALALRAARRRSQARAMSWRSWPSADRRTPTGR